MSTLIFIVIVLILAGALGAWVFRSIGREERAPRGQAASAPALPPRLPRPRPVGIDGIVLPLDSDPAVKAAFEDR
jgi:hypothetical protein